MKLLRTPYGWIGLPFLMMAAFVGYGCEDSFSPYQESELYFSMFGYLSAAEDTQYVRITPLRPSIFTETDSINAVVKLEATASGQAVVLRERIVRLTNGAIAHNYWTTERITPGETYRLSAIRPDGGSSSVTIAMPDSFPDPLFALLDTIPPYKQLIHITGVERLAEFIITYSVEREEVGELEQVPISYLDRVVKADSGYVLNFDAYFDVRRALNTNQCPKVVDVEVRLAAANAEWPDLMNVNDETIAVPNAYTNVDNGLGFVGGVVARVLPWPEVITPLDENRTICVLNRSGTQVLSPAS